MEDEYMTPREICEVLKISRTTISNMFMKGEFPNAFKWGDQIRIPKSDVEALKRQPFKERLAQ